MTCWRLTLKVGAKPGIVYKAQRTYAARSAHGACRRPPAPPHAAALAVRAFPLPPAPNARGALAPGAVWDSANIHAPFGPHAAHGRAVESAAALGIPLGDVDGQCDCAACHVANMRRSATHAGLLQAPGREHAGLGKHILRSPQLPRSCARWHRSAMADAMRAAATPYLQPAGGGGMAGRHSAIPQRAPCGGTQARPWAGDVTATRAAMR